MIENMIGDRKPPEMWEKLVANCWDIWSKRYLIGSKIQIVILTLLKCFFLVIVVSSPWPFK